MFRIQSDFSPRQDKKGWEIWTGKIKLFTSGEETLGLCQLVEH